MAAAAARKKLAALVLVTLLALLAGRPSAGLGQLVIVGPLAGLLGSTQSSCFVGWRLPSIVDSLVCGLLGRPYTLPTPAPAPTGYGLSVGYYSNASNVDAYCPDAEAIVRGVVQDAIDYNKYNPFDDGGRGVGAGLIRLFFHDAFVQGCDGSVLLNTTSTTPDSETERDGPPNKDSLRGFEVIDEAKEKIKAACKGKKVSCADILAFAARDASDILSNGAIKFAVPAGRFDGRVSLANETTQLPGPDSTLQELEAMFAAKGLSAMDMVTLSAAHSIGQARCLFFTGRLSEMNATYAGELKQTCAGRPGFRVNQDNFTAQILDSQFYSNVLGKFALFGSDDALTSSDETNSRVKRNVDEPHKWESDFADAMVKMGKIGVKSSKDGEIRDFCWRVNYAY